MATEAQINLENEQGISKQIIVTRDEFEHRTLKLTQRAINVAKLIQFSFHSCTQWLYTRISENYWTQLL